MSRDLDNLTPLDARNSLLLDPSEYKGAYAQKRDSSADRLTPYGQDYDYGHARSVSETRTHLLSDVGTAGEPNHRYSDRSDSSDRAPRLPQIQPTPAVGGGGYNAYRPY